MRLDLVPDAEAAALRVAELVGERVAEAVRERGRCRLALSGGKSPAPMFAALARMPLPWERVEIYQVDERVAPAGSASRNWTAIERLLLAPLGAAAPGARPMPVEEDDLEAAAARYAAELAASAGAPPVLDVVHLGLGADGHTASLFPGDPALDVRDAWAVATGEHAGFRRMTLTLPALAQACSIFWLVVGDDKAAALARLVQDDESVPAGRVPRDRARIVADAAAGRRSADPAR